MAKKPAAGASEFDAFLKRYPKTQEVDVFVHDLNGFLRGKRFRSSTRPATISIPADGRKRWVIPTARRIRSLAA
jgi:hypothetical protein